jgi:serine/threonine-protein kinase haspin
MPVLPTPDKTPEPEDRYTTYVSSLLSLSDGKGLISFDTWASALEPHFEVTKIAEASYSEVYRLTATSKTSGFTNESVLKLIPLKTPPDAPLACQLQERQTRDPAKQLMKEREAREEEDAWKSPADDVRSEVKLLQNLNHIPGFTQFRELTVLQGRPSASFNSAWKAWNSIRPRGKKSQFPDPGKKASYPDTQLWAVVEMQDAGTDCEKVMEVGGMSTIWEVWDVFWGVCLSVAKAEEACKFEHRDLHLENICIRSSRLRSGQDLTEPVIQEPLRRKLGFTGLDTTVIDYTLSRADILPTCLASASMSSSPISMPSSRSASQPFTPPSKPEVAHLDLDKDMSLFAGDASEEYQYEIYRYMRGVVFHGDPLHPSRTTIPDHNADVVRSDTLRRSPRKTPQHIRFDSSDSSGPPPFSLHKSTPAKAPCRPPMDPWRAFQPKTNLVWAHFILHQLLAHIRETDPRRLSDNQIMQNVKAASEDTAKVAKKARGLYKVLDRVRRLLEPRALACGGSLESVKELVVLAIEERWLRVGDVAGY